MKYLFQDATLLIFCKAPTPGLVKTRLIPALGAEQATLAHIALTRTTLNHAFERPLCPVQLYCAPDTGHGFFTRCAKDYPLTLAKQTGIDLGARMANALTAALAHYRRAVLIGCDCPGLTAGDLEQAFQA
ncbi:MAG: DUF2064 domain-containing protein, partial [Methylomonas sp.]|nr:DUF2064 domain-containing protein [Methylomonas sp.]